MTSKSDSMEIVIEGWLTKSPPTKRIWRARWRKRWFVLRHSGELPGQYFLCYYTDRNCRKLKGQIDLDQCEQVDAGFQFSNGKLKYQHMFDVKTPKRTYYLAADSEEEMNRWVDCICHVCGLKAFSQEDNIIDYENEELQSTSTASAADSSMTVESSPPVSPTNNISGPYIPISECISGKPLSSPVGLNQFLLFQNGSGPLTPSLVSNNTLSNQIYGRTGGTDEEYDLPRQLIPPGNIDLRNVSSEAGTPPLHSPGTDQESVFTDDESVVSSCTNKPSVNWETFPRPSDSSVECDLPKTAHRKFTKVAPSSDQISQTAPPPRPPKPPHLLLNSPTDCQSVNNKSPTNSENNESDSICPNSISDETYDFPRSHQINRSEGESQTEAVENTSQHCYTNAAPGRVQGDVFRYDFALPVLQSQEDLPESPRSETSSLTSNTAVYSNLSSPAFGNIATGQSIQPPPAVNRELKPGRKLSDNSTTSNEQSPLPPNVAPNVDRTKKPGTKKDDVFGSLSTIVLASPPAGSMGKRKPRAGPSPTPPNMQHNGNSLKHQHKHQSSSEDGGGYRTSPEDDQNYVYNQDSLCFHSVNQSFMGSTTKRLDEITYLDLDLNSADAGGNLNPSTPPAVTANPLPRSPQGITTATVYKTVDFVKTDALFNLRRQKAEEDRKQGTLTTAEPS